MRITTFRNIFRFLSTTLQLILLLLAAGEISAQTTHMVTLKLLIKENPASGVNVQVATGSKVSRFVSNTNGETTFPIPAGEVATIKTSMKGFRSDWIIIDISGSEIGDQISAVVLELVPTLPMLSADDPTGPEMFYQIINGQPTLQTDKPDLAQKIAARASMQQSAHERIGQMQGKANLHRGEAEKSFAEGNYNGARDQYRRALEAFPQEILTYYYDAAKVKEAMAECNVIIEREQKSNENYLLAIKTADAFYKDQDYTNAIKVYQQALKFQPSAPYAMGQIDKAKELQQAQQANRMLFDLLMSSALQRENEKALDRAMVDYKQAQALFPADKEVNNKISTLQKVLDERDRQYDASIMQGDRLLQGQNFEDALVSYRNARRLKPDEDYAKAKIDQITKWLNAMDAGEKPDRLTQQEEKTASKEKEAEQKAAKEYERLLTLATTHLDQRKPDEAAKNLEEARILTTQHLLDKTQLEALSMRLDELRQKITIELEYNKALQLGKQALASSLLQEAVTHFSKAVNIDPREEARKLEAETRERLLKLEQSETGYNEAIANGQVHYDQKQWEKAIQAFENALVFKPRDEAAQTKLKDSRSEQQRTTLVQEGELAMEDDDIELAIIKFNEAWQIQPIDVALKAKTEELESIHAKNILNRKARYDALIAEADRKWQQKVMDEAIMKYREALSLRPAEDYPKRMIREITTYLEERLVVELNRENLDIQDRKEQKFSFKPLSVRQRKNTYVLISARNMSGEELKVYLNYGQGKTKNGGIVFKAAASEHVQDYIIRVSSQYRWYDLNNDWIGIYLEGGAMEISVVQLATGE